MIDRRDYISLDWLAGEISASLGQCVDALHQYRSETEHDDALQRAAGQLHQVQGSLRMIEFTGAERLLGEMAECVLSFEGSSLSEQDIERRVEVLVQLADELPAYFARLRRVKRELPASLMIMFNELRAVCEQPLLSSTLLFTPQIDDDFKYSQSLADMPAENFAALAGKLLQMYRLALTALRRGDETDKNIAYLGKVAGRATRLCAATPQEPLWLAALALFEGLANDSIADGRAVDSILSRLEQALAVLAELGMEAAKRPLNLSLCKDVLFYVACSPSDARFIDEVQRCFRLDRVLADRELQQSDEERATAQLRCCELLADALLTLASRLREEDYHPGRFDLKEYTDVLAVLGLSDALFALKALDLHLAEELDAPRQGAVAQSLSHLAELLRTLPVAEAPLLFNNDPEAQLQLEGALRAVSDQGRAVLAEAQEALMLYVADHFRHSHLLPVPESLQKLATALSVAAFPGPAEILSSCSRYIEKRMLGENVPPSWADMDALADAIAAVDYYLERSAVTARLEDEGLLSVAEECIERLGFPVSTPRPVTPPAEVIPWPMVSGRDAVPENDASRDDFGAVDGSSTDDVGSDPDIIEVFLEEAGDVMALLAEKLPQWQQRLDSQDILVEVRRAYHTLKGSGRMVGADQIGELGWAIENMLNRVMDGRFTMDEVRFSVVEQASRKLPELLSSLTHGSTLEPEWLGELLQWADVLSMQQDADFGHALASEVEESQEEWSAPNAPTTEDGNDDFEVIAAPAEDSLLGIFIVEADTHLLVLENFLADIDACPVQLSDEVQRSLHTLKGSSNMAEVWAIANLITPLEGLVKELRSMRIPADQPLIEMMTEVVAYSRRLSESLRQQSVASLRTPADLLQRLEALSAEMLSAAEINAYQPQEGQLAPGVLNSFLAAFDEELQNAADLFASGSRPSAQQLRELAPAMGGFALRAEEINAEPIAELSQSLQVLFGHADDPVGDGLIGLATAAIDQLSEQLNQIAAEQTPEENAELLAQIRDYEQSLFETPKTVSERDSNVATVEFVEPEAEIAIDAPVLDPDGDQYAVEESPIINAEDPAVLPPFEEPVVDPAAIEEFAPAADSDSISPLPLQESAPAGAAPQSDDDEADREILEIFLEEANDLLESLDQAIQNWSENTDDDGPLDDMQRYLHTMKGGARLSGQGALGDLSHEFEAAILRAQTDPQRDNIALLAALHRYQDQLAAMAADASALLQAPLAAVGSEPEVEDTFDFAAVFAADRDANDDGLLVEGDDSPMTPAVRGPQEMIKVSAQLLERLINLAGETSISRGRNEEQLSEVHASLEEMEITIERLHEQVRRLDMETEAQIIFRQEQVGSEGADGFDPLEFDRYSQLQQYSRSLLESASDLVDLRNTLLDKNRDMETLLLQQSRIHSDLQEGLMRSQMVHFSRMVPRLRRGVRQVAGELGKQVDFKVYNAEGEMDRRVLERVVPALEHMLRNAIGHGIEDESQRLAAGKPALGEVAMRFDRQGGDVVIAISDDGAGINLEAVRKKAESLGLIVENADISERQLLEYIFHAGFSTAESLTQISGRGVGMDVVRNEVKQLGGSIDIRTEAGKGTRFEVRLPFTVSVNRALMVSVAGEIFAVPLNNIEGIVRVSPYELDVYYQEAASHYEYAGQRYNLRYLGQLMGHANPHLEGQVDLKPVLLIRNADPPTAVQVDALLGSREVVVKTLGPQFAAVPGLSGATVLGDGSVVVILDMLASIRADTARRLSNSEQKSLPVQGSTGNRLVMVVDDSVTVRKVTSRLLERQQMDVLLARDGMDAVTQLQDMERLPDVILLDIEMPRMDGFEVALRLRGNVRTQGIPIIMISSRTGEKHRTRAAGLGVRRFLGKPYQETQLLLAINEVSVEVSDQ